MVATFRSASHEPTWRWNRARNLVATGTYAKLAQDDIYVRLAKSFWAEYSRLEKIPEHTVFDKEQLFLKYPGIAYAWQLHTNTTGQNQRWLVEAHLLGRATPEQTAEFVGTEPDVVVWYEKLFFNILPYLKHEGYIINVVIGEAIHRGITDRDFDLLWKSIAYSWGYPALQEWVRPFQRNKITNARQLKPALSDAVSRDLDKKTAVALKTLQTYGNHEIILNAWNKAREIEANQGSTPTGEALILSNVSTAISSLQFLVGRDGLNGASGFADAGAELRADEQLQVDIGQGQQHKGILEMKFPEREKVVAAPVVQ
jgi:hypothetical protein